MRIAIVGIGGIGGYIGAKLCKQYTQNQTHEICFVQRGLHGKAIREHGLRYKGKQTELCKPHALFESFSDAGIFDLIIVCTKSRDLEQTVERFSVNLHDNSCVITLLNGVENAERIQKILPTHRVLQGCIYVSAAIESPGVVAQVGGAGNIFFGPEQGPCIPRDYEIQALLTEAGIPTCLSDSIRYEVWKKYLFISTFATITACYNKPIGLVVRTPELLELTHQIIAEICLIASCEHITLSQDTIDATLSLAFKIPEHTPSSMQLDVYAGKEPELDIFTAYICKKAEEYGVSVPVHQNMLSQIQQIVSSQKT